MLKSNTGGDTGENLRFSPEKSPEMLVFFSWKRHAGDIIFTWMKELMHNEMKDEQKIFSPSSLMAIFNFISIAEQEKKLFYVKAIVRKGKGKLYSDKMYAGIQDEHSSMKMTMTADEGLQQTLKEGQLIIASGFLSRKIEADGRIKAIFNLTELHELFNGHAEQQLRKELIFQKVKNGTKDIDHFIRSKIFKNESINIRIITGKGSKASADIVESIGIVPSLFHIHMFKISLSSKEELIAALHPDAGEKIDIIFATRGGGEMDIFDEVDVCKHLAGSKYIDRRCDWPRRRQLFISGTRR